MQILPNDGFNRSQPDERESGVFAAGQNSYTEIDPKTGNQKSFPENGLAIPFSNAQDAKETQIDDFTIFNKYIHYYHTQGAIQGMPAFIPFLSNYTIADPVDKYDCACKIQSVGP